MHITLKLVLVITRNCGCGSCRSGKPEHGVLSDPIRSDPIPSTLAQPIKSVNFNFLPIESPRSFRGGQSDWSCELPSLITVDLVTHPGGDSLGNTWFCSLCFLFASPPSLSHTMPLSLAHNPSRALLSQSLSLSRALSRNYF